jgi:hypothetical protein
MTLLSFHQLSPLDQQQHVLQEGIHLADRQEPKYVIQLYAVDSFYVEFYFYKKMAQAVMITASDSTKLVEPYLSRIDLSELQSYH